MTDIRLRLARWIAPDTHAVVPREPTKKMIKAACKAMSPDCRPTQDWVSVNEKHKIRYRAMLEAA